MQRGETVKKILFIIGKSQYDSTNVFLEEMREALVNQGVEVDVLDSYNESSFIQMRQHVQKQLYDAIFSINAMALEEASSLGRDLLKGDVIYSTMLMDHPFIHHERLKNSYDNIMVLSPDTDHVDYLTKYYPHIRYGGFLPHGGCQAQNVIPYRNRTVNISFMGSYGSPESIWKEFRKYPPQMKCLLEECCAYLLEHTDETIEQALQERMGAMGIVCPAEEFAAVGAEFRMVDRYVRSWFRDKVVRTIVEAGIPVDVYGDGWENMDVKNKNCLRVHDRVGFKESLEIVADSKISLNVMPWFKNGSHDRVFSAMLCGSVCLTDPSGYLTEECKEGEGVMYYQLDCLEELPGKITSLLGNDTMGEEIAGRGKALAEQRHTWADRAMMLLDYLHTAER